MYLPISKKDVKMEFKNKIVLITGAGSGIGKAAAFAFAKEGAQVVVADISIKMGEETAEEITAHNGKAIFIAVDVAQHEEVLALVSEVKKKFDRLDIAINNAGIAGVSARTHEYPLDDFDRVMQINTAGVFYGLKTQIPLMLQQGSGVIINTASIAGLKGLPNSLAYSASKHAVVGMTKTAAMEYGKKNIRINALCPVFTVTPLFNPDEIEKVAAGIPDKLKANVPMKRFANVSEQVDALLWLASDKASFVTGLALPVDGGLTA
jgi:NAD(P)-dependent dehydrogenase (short-subunit alcohol dehydrogenase family)